MEHISHLINGDFSWSVSEKDFVANLQKDIYKCIYYSSIYIHLGFEEKEKKLLRERQW
jgi:hypothetical protein